MLTEEILRQLLYYDPTTGVFTWLTKPGDERYVRTWNTRFAGKTAGRTKPNKNGYLELGIDAKLYYSHRLAWLYMTGEWPKVNIDHEDTNKSNNAWENLREATVSQNGFNRGAEIGNATGYKGVIFFKQGNYERYRSEISVNGTRYRLGYFHTPEEAHEAYGRASIKYHGEFARS